MDDSDLDFDQTSIEALREAANQIAAIAKFLKSNGEVFNGTNLPVSEAVNHIIVCLTQDAAHLNKLAEICSESAPVMKRFK